MKSSRLILSTTVALALCFTPPKHAGAEDIDLFVSSSNTARNPNILVILDNSANWSSAAQHWPGGVKQGQSELSALRTVAGELTDNVNLGLMMLTPGVGSDVNGGYIRFHIRQMTEARRQAFQDMIGPDSGCNDGVVTVDGVEIPNCIYKNFDNAFEKVGTDKVDYSEALYEAFKYFGGFTDPARAQSDPAVAGTPVNVNHFGAQRLAGTVPANLSIPEYKKFDAAAYTDGTKSVYNPPISSTNSCARTYIILIGNGFPSSEPTGSSPAKQPDLLAGVNGSTTQLLMPQFTTTSSTVTSIIGTACGSGANAGERVTDCLKNSAALQAANPADSYTCINPGNEGVVPCNGNNNFLHDVQSSRLVITVNSTGTFAAPASAKARAADEWARYLQTTDVNSAAGQQNVSIYTIDVFKDAQSEDQTALLLSMARYGGGKYFQATNENAILEALRQILNEIQSVSTVFASASLPINATSRAQNENQVFIGMFKPDSGARPRWYGNLKRYQIGLFDGEAKLADADGILAENPSTGFLLPCARSFWTSDSGESWNFPQAGIISFAGQCPTAATSPFSDKPDGAQVEKGAVAEVLRRGNNPPLVTPFTYLDSATTPTPATVEDRTFFTCSNTGTTVTCNTGAVAMHTFNATNVSQAALGAADTTERDRIIAFTRGEDFATDAPDLNLNTQTSDVRPTVHGDVVHSRPLPVNYGGVTGVVIHYGSNDGTFRAVRGRDGKELWAFIAPEHHSKLKRLRDNTPLIRYQLRPDPATRAKDYFFDGGAGLFQTFNAENIAQTSWVFPSMRRGGRMLYGFDVSDPLSPKLKWRLGCPNLANDTGCTSGFSNIGQTWSTPGVALIKGYDPDNDPTTSNPVIITGGGYDTCEDDEDANPSCTTPKGSNVYVIDANTGALVKGFGTGTVNGSIDRSVATDITLVDRNFDGFADHGYFADTGGNLYRIDFANPSTKAPLASTAWTVTKIARTNQTPAAAGRKFLFAPAALQFGEKMFLTLGSGDREQPLRSDYPFETPIQNRFYMFVDSFPTPVLGPPAIPVLPVDLEGATIQDRTNLTPATCGESLAPGLNGWRIDLNAGTGEQTVTSSTIFGGLVFFSTNRPLPPTNACGTDLGEARGYAVNLLNASGAVGTEALCGGQRSGIFQGGGLPPSPVTGTVTIGGKPVTIMIGGVQRTKPISTPIGSQKVKPTIAQTRSRLYWYRKGDQ